MNITGGTNLSLYEVQEAADIVASASDEDVNMIFGSVINDNLKDEIVVTVIATGFIEQEPEVTKPQRNPLGQGLKQNQSIPPKREVKREEHQQTSSQPRQNTQSSDDTLDIPTFLRNRNKR